MNECLADNTALLYVAVLLNQPNMSGVCFEEAPRLAAWPAISGLLSFMYNNFDNMFSLLMN